MDTPPQGMEIIHKYFSDFTPQQGQQFAALQQLYREWNEKINVVSRKDIDQLYLHHVLHSLAIAAVFDFPPGTEVVDIGTGGGFPGVPLAIFFPQVQFHLVDSIGKKLKVIEAVKGATGVQNISTQHSRAEDIKGRSFHFAVSRAVAPLNELWQWSKPLLKSKGVLVKGAEGVTIIQPGLICLKGGNLKNEIEESKLKPHVVPVDHLFQEEHFKEKFLLYCPQ